MNKDVTITVANPAGNITIFVKTPIKKDCYQKVANALLNQTNYNAEQVAFVLNKKKIGVDAHLDMSGLEFCGNATRSYGLILAKMGIGKSDENNNIINIVKISGADNPITTISNPNTGFAKVNMPIPKSIEQYKYDFTLVDLDGIVHLVLDINNYPVSTFDKIKNEFYEAYNPPAFGIMYYDGTTSFMIPVVYVRDVNTTYHEGSCGSGTVALTTSLSKDLKNGTFTYKIKQPDGIIESTVEKKNGAIISVSIEGIVEIYDEKTVTIKI